MYCSTCGTPVDSKLSFCQRCGARLGNAAAAMQKNSANLQELTIVTGVVGIGGLGITLGLIAVLLNYSVVPEVIVILALAFLCAVFGITFWMTQQTSRVFNHSQNAPEHLPEPAQINQPSASRLAEWRDADGSVVENTTRTLGKNKV